MMNICHIRIWFGCDIKLLLLASTQNVILQVACLLSFNFSTFNSSHSQLLLNTSTIVFIISALCQTAPGLKYLQMTYFSSKHLLSPLTHLLTYYWCFCSFEFGQDPLVAKQQMRNYCMPLVSTMLDKHIYIHIYTKVCAFSFL